MKKLFIFTLGLLISIGITNASFENAKHLCADGEFLAGNDTTTCKNTSGILDMFNSCAENQILKWDGDNWICADNLIDTDVKVAVDAIANPGYLGDGTNGVLRVAAPILSADGGDFITLGLMPCVSNQVLKWSGGWTCLDDANTTYSAGNGLSLNTTTFSISASACTTGQYLFWNGSTWSCNDDISGNAATATALATNGTNCSAGQYATGVDASGNAEGCSAPSVSGGNLSLDCTCVDNSDFGHMCYGTYPGDNAVHFMGCKADPDNASLGKWFVLDTFGQ